MTSINTQVHMFWAYGNFSKLEYLAASSFLKWGFHLNIWTYSQDLHAPNGSHIRDAREIIKEASVFTYKNGSYAAFANLFRYAVLSAQGGLWVDADVICMSGPEDLGKTPFLVSQRLPDGLGIGINNNVVFNPQPQASDIISLALAFTERFPIEKLQWGDCGPKLLSILVKGYPGIAFPVKKPDYANPIEYWKCPQVLFEDKQALPFGAAFIHLNNENWRRASVNKDDPYPPNSIMGKLAEMYL